MYYWYKFFTYLFYPVAPIYLFFRKLKKKEDKISYKEKLSLTKANRKEGFLVWLHVASVGEAMSVLPLVESFEENKKVKKILITSLTLSSGNILRKRYRDNSKIFHQFLPLDIPILTKKFLELWKPNISIFIDSEIWPNLILQIKKKKIPLLLINARITKKTFDRWKLLPNFAKKIFEKFDLCIASNKETENYLSKLGAQNVKNLGNLKFTRIKSYSDNSLDNSLINKIKDRKIWCAASTHYDEEILCGKAHLEIKKKFANVLTIIIPRHIYRVEEIKKELSELKLKVALYSEKNLVDENTDIILVDSYGESLKFYNLSKYVFLGKSLVKTLVSDSGQNPIESARLGCKIFHGPNFSNFIEIYNYLEKLGIAKIVNNTNEISLSLIEEFKLDRPKDQDVARKIEDYGQKIFNNVIIEMKKYI